MPLEELRKVLNKLIRNYKRLKRKNEELEKSIALYKEREKYLQKRIMEIEKKLEEVLNRFSLIEK